MARWSSAGQLKETLDSLEQRYNAPSFIENDPISIPHLFSQQMDREVAGFLVSIISWGNRTMILRSGRSMVERLDGSPWEFVRCGTPQEFQRAARGFVHRTFNDEDFLEVLTLLSDFIKRYGSLGSYFEQQYTQSGDLRPVLASFYSDFFAPSTPCRTRRHISSIARGSACKRLCMYLRWMVRRDGKVDFGLWREIPPSALYIPLDVHSARQGRDFGLLTRRQNDWRAVEELTTALRELDRCDPTKYDFALFGVGVDQKNL